MIVNDHYFNILNDDSRQRCNAHRVHKCVAGGSGDFQGSGGDGHLSTANLIEQKTSRDAREGVGSREDRHGNFIMEYVCRCV